MSDQDPLGARNSPGPRRRDWGGAGPLVQPDRITGAVIELGRARRLAEGPRERMVRDLLRVLDCTTVLQVGGDAGSAEGVAAGRVQ
jgi:hypothetical protein